VKESKFRIKDPEKLVKTLATSEDTIASARQFGESLGKTVVVAPDISGFIVTRLFTPFLLGAVHMLEDGIASRDEIDNSCRMEKNLIFGEPILEI
jgi:3-hydroxybutyryl-CoA dehydrogenase